MRVEHWYFDLLHIICTLELPVKHLITPGNTWKTSLHSTSTASGLSSLTGVCFAFALVWFSHQQFFTLFSHDFPSPPFMPCRIAALAYGFSVCSYKHTGITMQKLKKYERLLALRVNWKMMRWKKNVWWWARLQLQILQQISRRRRHEWNLNSARAKGRREASLANTTTATFAVKHAAKNNHPFSSISRRFVYWIIDFYFFFTSSLFFAQLSTLLCCLFVVCSTAYFKNTPTNSIMHEIQFDHCVQRPDQHIKSEVQISTNAIAKTHISRE